MRHQFIEVMIEYENSHNLSYSCEFKQREFICTSSQRLLVADDFIVNVKPILKKMETFSMITIEARWQYEGHYSGGYNIIKSKRYCKRSWGELHWSRWNEAYNSYGREEAEYAKDGWIYDDKLHLVQDIRDHVDAANQYLLKVLAEAADKAA